MGLNRRFVQSDTPCAPGIHRVSNAPHNTSALLTKNNSLNKLGADSLIKMPTYEPPPGAFYTELDFPEVLDPMHYMGRGGWQFKHITKLSKCEYIWYDFDRRVIEIWGYQENWITKAKRMLDKRIKQLVINLNKKNES